MSFLEVNLTEEEKDAIRRQDGYNEGFEYDVIEEITGLNRDKIEKL